MTLKPDDKHRIHLIRKTLERGEEPSKKNVYWLLDFILDQERNNDHLTSLLAAQEKENLRLKTLLDDYANRVIEKIHEVIP